LKTKELADWLGLAPGTIRTWTGGEFKRYLSPTGQGGGGRIRNFTDIDCRVIAFTATLIDNGTPRGEIHISLNRMQADDWADLPPMPAAPPSMGPIRMISQDAAETAITSQRSSSQREISILDERLDKVTEDLESERTRRADLEVELRRVIQELGKWRGVVLSGVALVIVLAIVALALAAVLLTRGG